MSSYYGLQIRTVEYTKDGPRFGSSTNVELSEEDFRKLEEIHKLALRGKASPLRAIFNILNGEAGE